MILTPGNFLLKMFNIYKVSMYQYQWHYFANIPRAILSSLKCLGACELFGYVG